MLYLGISFRQSIHDSNWFKTNDFFHIYKLNCGKLNKQIEKTLKIALKSPESPCFFHFLEKKSFLNGTLGLRKSFLKQTTYVLKY